LPDIRVTDDPAKADIIAVSHTKDLEASGAELRRRLSPDQKLILLSEEPFWDTVWGQNSQARQLVVQTGAGALPMVQLNHQTSSIYNFARIPYFLLTQHHFRTRYAVWFARNARFGAQDWRQHFARVANRVAFVMARRTSARYEVAFSLCNQRTAIAGACQGAVHFGQGWQEQPRRQELPDWHLDKLMTLDQKFQFVCAIENTHLPNYVTEKMFDAYAVGAIPLYMAGADHRVHELMPQKAWVNLLNVPPTAVPGQLAEFLPDTEFLDAYVDVQHALAALFRNADPLIAELDRLRDALIHEFTVVLNE